MVHPVIQLPKLLNGEACTLRQRHAQQRDQFHYFVGIALGEYLHTWLTDPAQQCVYALSPYVDGTFYGIWVPDVDAFFKQHYPD